MFNKKNIFKVIFAILLLVMLPFGNVGAIGYDTAARDFLVLINNYRAANSLGELSMDAKLQDAADWMSADMLNGCVSGGYACSHTDSTGRDFSTRLRAFGYPSGISASAGENIAWGTGRILSAADAFNMWKNSPGHNANMLKSSYSAIGISRSCSGSACAWVNDFGSKIIQSLSLVSTPTLTPTLTPIPSPTTTSTPTPSILPTITPSSTPTLMPVPTPIPTPTPSLIPTPTLSLNPTLTQTPSLTPTPTPIITSTPIVSGAQKTDTNALELPEGSLIRGNGEFDIYVVKYRGTKKFKRLILSPSVFKNYGHLKWENVITIDPSVLDSFKISELVRVAGDSKVYELHPMGDTGEKKWIKTQDVFIRLELDWDSVYEINQFDRDSYVTGIPME